MVRPVMFWSSYVTAAEIQFVLVCNFIAQAHTQIRYIFWKLKQYEQFDISNQLMHKQQGNSVARDLPPTGSEANTTIIVVFLYILDIDSHCPSKQKYILFFIPRIIFSRDVGNSIKCKKTRLLGRPQPQMYPPSP